MKKTVVSIPTKRLELGKSSEKSTVDSKDLLRLSQDISQQGIREPLCVRKRDGEERYEVIAGYRRFLATRILGFQTIPCRVI